MHPSDSIMHAAELRRQDLMTQAARERLVSQAAPIQSSAPTWQVVASRASLAVRTARRTLGSIAVITLNASGKARGQAGLHATR